MRPLPLMCVLALVPSVAAAKPVPVDQTPIELHRRAADFLEERRDLHGGGWADARLDGTAEPIFEPGITGPAYYEYALVDDNGDPRGYILLSTGEHDFPVPVAALGGAAPSQQLEELADRADLKVFRLGHDAFVAEADGAKVAELGGGGTGRLVGFDPAWLELPHSASAGSTRWDPQGGLVESPPSVGSTIHFEPWKDWPTQRDGYADNHDPLLTIRARNAQRHWDTEKMLAAHGEALQPGDFRDVPLLARGGARWKVSGAGADHVSVERVQRPLQGDTVLRVSVNDADPDAVEGVTIALAYAGTARATEAIHLSVYAGPVANAPETVVVPGSTRQAKQCGQMAFRTFWKTYLHAHDGGGRELTGRGRWIGDYELFRVGNAGPGAVSLRTHDGKYVTAIGGGGGAIRATATSVGARETFFLVPSRDGQRFGIKTGTGHYLISRPDGSIDSNSTNFAGWEQFTLERCEPKRSRSVYAGAHWWDAWKKVRKYGQIPAHHGPSNSQCASGCGATAWGMLFGFHDVLADKRDPRWRNHWGIYRRNGGRGRNAVAPQYMWPVHGGQLSGWNRHANEMHTGVANMVWEISRKMNDWALAGCSHNGQKWTAPMIMGRAHKYLRGRANVRLFSDYDGVGNMTEEGRNKAGAVIRDLKQPVVIGIGQLSHYPLAFGYDYTKYRVWKREGGWSRNVRREAFLIHNGHQEAYAQLVPFDTWEQGWIVPR